MNRPERNARRLRGGIDRGEHRQRIRCRPCRLPHLFPHSPLRPRHPGGRRTAMSTLLIDPFSGVSGDMFLGALCDLSGDAELLETLPGMLNLKSSMVHVPRTSRCGITAAAVHGTTKERIHFHEVGAVDSIIDIVGSALLLDRLNVKRVLSKPVCTGYGFVNCAHG